MRAQRFTRYGVLGGLLAGLACAGNSARTEDTTIAQDTTTAETPPAYTAPVRDTSLSTVTDSVNSGEAKSGATEIKPGESTVIDTVRAEGDTTAQ